MVPRFISQAAGKTSLPSLETLAFYYGTDKSHDDHKYTDFYSLLFDGSRLSVNNVTEIGVMTGQSLQMWSDYFVNARVWASTTFSRRATC